ncbi:hypothetical protein [Thauera chlorobenzoica]|uniref:Membrane protein n=1 Tax=Thauera chlorobenzoica TaxID=96773 RepID=A0A1H5U5U6_9RHOO|nr:hypothetical protein [Thauera chlorobenzoica]APR03746.1 membrane protein [Thauera chlorobenzoica]SEF70396.1 hypothetical protein SAMN05216242_10466 [Thauera chlorobenzoica]
MQLTIFGLGFVPLALFVALFARAWLPALVVFSAVFQATSVLDVPVGKGAFGVSPYNLVALLAGIVLLARLMRERSLSFLRSAPRIASVSLTGYVVIALVGALLLPHLFDGTLVNLLIERHGMDRAPVPLAFTLANAVQAVNLCVHAVVLLFLLQAAARSDWRGSRLLWALALAAALMLGIGVYERLAPLYGWPSAVKFWMNNPGYVQYHGAKIAGFLRIAAPMSEASYASTFVAALMTGLLAVMFFGPRRSAPHWGAMLVSTLLLALVLINTLGSTGWAAAGVSCAAIVLWLSASAMRGSAAPRLRPRAISAWMAVLLIGATCTWVWKASPAAPQAAKVVDNLLLKKLDGGSARVRNRSNDHALQVVEATRGLGVGLGSNRASSFFASLVSNTGIPGALLFVAMLASLLLRYARATVLSDAQRFVAVALATATLAMGLAIPDLNLPVYWIFIFLAFLFCPPAVRPAPAPNAHSHG